MLTTVGNTLVPKALTKSAPTDLTSSRVSFLFFLNTLFPPKLFRPRFHLRKITTPVLRCVMHGVLTAGHPLAL